jgi:hypothetical protein
MSRSRRKTPIFGYSLAESEARDKAIWHRRHRRVEGIAVKAAGVEYMATSYRAHSNRAWMAKDGRQYYPDDPRYMRK